MESGSDSSMSNLSNNTLQNNINRTRPSADDLLVPSTRSSSHNINYQNILNQRRTLDDIDHPISSSDSINREALHLHQRESNLFDLLPSLPQMNATTTTPPNPERPEIPLIGPAPPEIPNIRTNLANLIEINQRSRDNLAQAPVNIEVISESTSNTNNSHIIPMPGGRVPENTTQPNNNPQNASNNEMTDVRPTSGQSRTNSQSDENSINDQSQTSQQSIEQHLSMISFLDTEDTLDEEEGLLQPIDIARALSYQKFGIAAEVNVSNTSFSSIVKEKVGRKRLSEWQSNNGHWRQFDHFRQKNMFTDSEIICEDSVFPIHKCVLSAGCEYFRALYQFYQVVKKEDNKIIFDSKDDKAYLVKMMLDYIYTKQVNINYENILPLLKIADYYGIEGLVKECIDFLADNISVDNCVSMRHLAILYQRRYLLFLADSFIKHNFELISKVSEEFNNLRPYELCRFLKSDELNVKNEEVVFEILMKWIDHDLDNRKGSLKDTLGQVRMGLMDSEYFMSKVKSHPVIEMEAKKDQKLREVIREGLKTLYNFQGLGQTVNDSSIRYNRPRLPHEVLLAIGGWSGGAPTNEIECYDSRDQSWKSVTRDMEMNGERPRAYHGLVFFNRYLYIIGGFDGQNYFNSVRKINVINFTKEESPPMNARRCYVSCCLDNKTIWAIGGMNGQSRLDSCECFTIGQNYWTEMPKMNEKRSDADATALNGKIYVVGGFNGVECLASVEFFCKENYKWIKVTPMESRRSGVSAITLNDRIYAVGGFDGNNRLRTAEYYSTKNNTWHYTSSMHTARSNFGIEVLDNQIYAIGGFNGYQTTYNCEAYDEENDEWIDIQDMNVFRSALACVTVKKIPMENMKKFAAPRIELYSEDESPDLYTQLKIATDEDNLFNNEMAGIEYDLEYSEGTGLNLLMGDAERVLHGHNDMEL